MCEADLLKIDVKLNHLEGPARESAWATPLHANGGGGVYRVESNLAGTVLRIGDVVRCTLDANSRYQVTALEEVAAGTLMLFEHPVACEALVQEVLARWEQTGVEVSRPVDGYVYAFAPEGFEPDFAEELAERALPRGWSREWTMTTQVRLEEIVSDVDFTLDTVMVAPAGPVNYWAPDDPKWALLGAGDPDSLARLQRFAVEDPRVLATIREGRHADVLEFVSLAMASDVPVSGWPSPLLADPDCD